MKSAERFRIDLIERHSSLTHHTCRQLAELEERLDDVTVDEMLELYPDLAQEIKDEIEAGDYSKTNAGHKLSIEG